MDNNTAPWKALENRKLSKELADSMESDLTLDELTESLCKYMNPSSRPGINGFTFTYLRVFLLSSILLTSYKLIDSPRYFELQ